jgi:hypothetical protein
VSAGPGQVGCDWTGSGSHVRDWCGPGRGRAWRDQDDARGSDVRENQKKERAGSDTIPTYVGRGDTSADEHKRASLCGSHDALCSWAT